MAEISYHRKDGFKFLPPAARTETRLAFRDRLSLRTSMLAVIIASLMLWAVVAGVIYVIVVFA
jgi:hypothetical protein